MPKKRSEPEAPAYIRWMIRKDLPTVLNIEERCFEYPWGEEDFIRCLRQRSMIGMVAERGDQVVGFMIYELHKFRLHLISMAVDPDYSRQGIGRTMVEKLVSKMSYQGRNRVMLEVRETNLPAQLFFKSMGFRAVGILNHFYDDCDEDAYQFQLRASQIVPSDMECVE
jgi:[ribosomal protein S18]-alanine N-acetyltransferase